VAGHLHWSSLSLVVQWASAVERHSRGGSARGRPHDPRPSHDTRSGAQGPMATAAPFATFPGHRHNATLSVAMPSQHGAHDMARRPLRFRSLRRRTFTDARGKDRSVRDQKPTKSALRHLLHSSTRATVLLCPARIRQLGSPSTPTPGARSARPPSSATFPCRSTSAGSCRRSSGGGTPGPSPEVTPDAEPGDQALAALGAVRASIDDLDDIAGRLARSLCARARRLVAGHRVEPGSHGGRRATRVRPSARQLADPPVA
jgi:hypothetical protein